MKGKIFLGIIFILIGIGALFQQLGFGDLGTLISTYWPVILIFIGLWQLCTKPVSKVSGTVILLVGVYFQLKELDIITYSITKFFWPVLIIVIGISMLLKGTTSKDNYKSYGNEINDDVVDNVSLFSVTKMANVSTNFRGGSLVTAFGGIDIDLRNANFAREGARLDVTAAFGGIDIIVPPNCKVVMKGVPIFGGWSNKTRNNEYINAEAPVLVVNCFVAFGGVDVKN